MKHKTIRVCIVLLAIWGCVSGLYASAQNERTVDFQSIDMEGAAISTIKQAYADAWSSYEKQYAKAEENMEKAYGKWDSDKFFAARDVMRSLEAPSVSEQQTETLVTRLMSAGEEEKKEISSWLFENSRYYHPTLSLSLENKGPNSRFSYHQSVSVEPGTSVTLPTLNASSQNGVFVGWGKTPDEVTYRAGEEITMPYTDQKLYAIFESGVQFSDSVTSFDQFSSQSGSVTAPTLTPPDDSYIFSGWYDTSGGKLEGESATVEEGQSASYRAAWKSVKFSDVSVRYCKDMTIPSGEQLTLRFSLANQGNTTLKDLSVTLESDDESLSVLTKELSASRMAAGDERSGSFIFLTDALSGSAVNAKIVVTDGEGDSWSYPVTFTVR